MPSPAAAVTAAPALYARWFRVDVPAATDDDVARCWRMSSPADRRFWADLGAALAAVDAAGVLCHDSADQLVAQATAERQKLAMVTALSSIRATYAPGTMAHDTAHAALDDWARTPGEMSPDWEGDRQ